MHTHRRTGDRLSWICLPPRTTRLSTSGNGPSDQRTVAVALVTAVAVMIACGNELEPSVTTRLRQERTARPEPGPMLKPMAVRMTLQYGTGDRMLT